jgi:hypothetical protein
MIDLKKIPKPIYEELVALMGEVEADRFILKHDYHIWVIVYRIRYLELASLYRRKPLLFTVVAVVILASIIGFFIWDFIFN